MKNIIAFLVLVGIFKAGDAAITEWTTPVIASASGTGALSVAEDQALNTAITTYVAVTDATTVTYSLVAAVAPFAVASNGDLTITAALDHETTSSYILEIQAVDDATTAATGTATITVTVTDVDVAPTFAQTTYTTTVADSAAASASVFTASATDQDSGDTITYTIAAGDTNNHFDINGSTGVITVNSNVTLVACTTYDLRIEAADDESPPKNGTATINITVTPCSGATMIVVSTVMILFAALLTILQ